MRMANLRWTMGLCAAALAVTALPASAFNPQPEPPLGVMGLARTQTAILNVVLTQPPDPAAPACVMVLSFVDATGRRFHDASGAEVTKRVDLRGNVAQALVLRWQDAVPDGQLRVPIRGVVQPPDPALPPDPQCAGLVATLEIVDLLGATRVLAVSRIQPTPDDGAR
jgi:hypothetical protein